MLKSYPLKMGCDIVPDIRLQADLGSYQYAALQHNWSGSGSCTELQQQAVAAAEELAQLVVETAKLRDSLHWHDFCGEDLHAVQLAYQQRLEQLEGDIARLSLHVADQDTFSCSISTSSLDTAEHSEASCSSAGGTYTVSSTSCRESISRLGSNWFTRVTCVADSSEKQAMVEELQDLLQQASAEEAEMAAVEAELLERTDGRIHDESELRDELARHVAELEDQVQANNEEEEDEDAEVCGLRMQLVNLRRYTEPSAAVNSLQKTLAQQQAANSILHAQLCRTGQQLAAGADCQ